MKQCRLYNYLEYIKREKDLADSTLESYKRDLLQFRKYLIDKQIDNITNVNKTTVITYMVYLQKKGKSAATVARSLASIRGFFQYLLNIGIIKEDPTYNLRPPKEERKIPDILSKEEVDFIIVSASWR